MSRSLFEEAIADARQLREAAEQNAKNAIIEAVTPRIREFIENQLVGGASINENDDFLLSSLSEADNEDEEEVALDESALKSLMSLMNGAKAPAGDEDSNALSEAVASLSEEEQSRLLRILREGDIQEAQVEEISDGAYEVDLDELKASIVKEMKPTKAPHGEAKMKKEMKHEEDDLYELDEMMDDEEEDLDEADLVFSKEELESLGIDAATLKSMTFGVKVAGEEGEEEGEIEVAEVPPEGEEAEAPPAEEEEEEGDQMAETVYEIDENMLRRELARLREAKSKKPKGTSEKSHKAAAAAFGGGTVEGDVLDTEVNELDTVKKKMMKEARENRALKQQLNDYRGAVETLREQLSDLNLFNAKLLYVNKILQNKDVAPNQRRAIIEALDGASNLREAKLLYESLATSISSKNESLNESVKHTAGLASRPVTSSSARMSGAGEVDRWAILAGLK
jgi:hypothetical protein